jgi:predicted transcriptional regulator
MHPTLNYQMAQARIDDLRRQAQRDALARAARQSRSWHPRQAARPVPRLLAAARRALTISLVTGPRTAP